MAAFVFVEWIPVLPVVAGAERADDRQPLLDQAREDEAARDLVLDAGPDFVAVGER